MLPYLVTLFLFLPSEGTSIQDLVRLCKKVQDAQSYTVDVEIVESGGAEGGRDRTDKVVCRVVRGQPILFERGDMKVYLQRNRAAYRGKDGKWALLDRAKMRGAARRRGGAKGEGPVAVATAMADVPVPHHALQDLKDKLTDANRVQRDGLFVHTASLTPKAAREMSGGGRGRAPKAKEGPAPEFSGKLGVFVKPDGSFVKLEIHTRSSLQRGERTVERKRKVTMKMRDLNRTEFKVPEKVLEALKG